ncbi:hypothetical protein AM228_22495 [Planktothricoides sp. SR001]|nr:hypothetical protein AM228_22495 [Planktothricoides sp. SR001]
MSKPLYKAICHSREGGNPERVFGDYRRGDSRIAPTGEPNLVLSCGVKQQKTRQRAGFFAQTSSGLG